MWLEVTIVLALILTNGIFSGAEIALLSVRKTRVRELIDSGSSRASSVKRLRDTPEVLLATVQVGITVVGAAAAAFGGASIAGRMTPLLEGIGFGHYSRAIAVGIVVSVISVLSLILGELVPKSLALRYAEKYSLLVAPLLLGVAWILRPIVWFLTSASNLVLRLFGDKTSFTETRVSPEELQQMVEEAAKSGALDPQAGEIVSRAFDFPELTAYEVMVSRDKIAALPKQATRAEVERVVLESGHQRLPVYDGNLDNIVGYILAKDMLLVKWQEPLILLHDIMRPAFFVPESTRAVDLLRSLQRQHAQMAVVVDDQGTVSGLITMEDLLEELVGEIFSETDKPDESIRSEPGGTALVWGSTQIRDVNRALNLELPEGENYSTVAGLCIEIVGWIPRAGQVLQTKDGGTELQIVDASPRRVRSVRIRRTTPPESMLPETSGATE